jgi:hypothetical protein
VSRHVILNWWPHCTVVVIPFNVTTKGLNPFGLQVQGAGTTGAVTWDLIVLQDKTTDRRIKISFFIKIVLCERI